MHTEHKGKLTSISHWRSFPGILVVSSVYLSADSLLNALQGRDRIQHWDKLMQNVLLHVHFIRLPALAVDVRDLCLKISDTFVEHGQVQAHMRSRPNYASRPIPWLWEPPNYADHFQLLRQTQTHESV